MPYISDRDTDQEQDTELALIHIPLHLYTSFVQPLLHLLLPSRSSSPLTITEPSTGAEHARSRLSWAYEHPFANISITPVECSVTCSRVLADQIFRPVLESLPEKARSQVAISHDDYVVVQVDGEGLEAGQRVVELTAPLAMNGIPIFFITTYFSDYILVPLRSRAIVISALEDRGFAFESNTEAFVNVSSPLMTTSTLHSRSGSAIASHNEDPSETVLASLDDQKLPSTPPPSSLAELEARTFSLMSRRNISPIVDTSLQLVLCAGRRDLSMRPGSDSANTSAMIMNTRLQLGLVRCLIRMPRARFFSVTLTDTEPASLLLEKSLLAEFEDGVQGEDEALLLGSKEDILIPITLDLKDLPMESTGIVCGIAGRLVGRMRSRPGTEDAASPGTQLDESGLETVEMSYLSTARAGTVMVAEAQLQAALECLEQPSNGRGGQGDNVSIPRPPDVEAPKPIPIRAKT